MLFDGENYITQTDRLEAFSRDQHCLSSHSMYINQCTTDSTVPGCVWLKRSTASEGSRLAEAPRGGSACRQSDS